MSRRPELRLDEPRELLARAHAGLAPHVVVVEEDREQPHVVARRFGLFVVVGANLRAAGRRRRQSSPPSSVMSLKVSIFCGLSLSVTSKSLWLQVVDRIAVLVGDDDVDADEVDAGAEDRRLRRVWRWRGGWRRLRLRRLAVRRRRLSLRGRRTRRAPAHECRLARDGPGDCRVARSEPRHAFYLRPIAVLTSARVTDADMPTPCAPPLTTLSEDERLFRDSVYAVRRPRDPPARPRDGRAGARSRATSSTSCSTSASWASKSRGATAAAARRFFHAVLAVEALSRVDPSIGVLVDVQNTLVINALLRWGNDEQQATLPAAARRRHRRRLRAVGEPARAATRSRWRRAPSSAATTGCSPAASCGSPTRNEADLFIVFANVNPDAGLPRHHGVPRRARLRRASRSARRKTSSGIRASSTCELLLEDCRVPRRTSSARSARATRWRSRR